MRSRNAGESEFLPGIVQFHSHTFICNFKQHLALNLEAILRVTFTNCGTKSVSSLFESNVSIKRIRGENNHSIEIVESGKNECIAWKPENEMGDKYCVTHFQRSNPVQSARL